MSGKIVVSEVLHEDALELLAARSTLLYDPDLHARPDELRSLLGDAAALLVRNRTKVDGALLEGSAVEVVGRVGVGLDNIAVDELRRSGVRVTWAPGTNAASVAEYVVGAMLSLARLFLVASPVLHAGEWRRQEAIGFELQGKTLGIVGLGDIGSRVARRAAALGMRLLASDPVVGPNSFAVQELGIELVPLEVLLRSADVVTLHTPLLPSTRGMIGTDTLPVMKEGAYLINTARGGLVDEAALAEALGRGKLAGAALDVRDPEPPGLDDPLAGLSNVLLTPHIAGVTEESIRRASMLVAGDVLRVLAGERPQSEVPAAS